MNSSVVTKSALRVLIILCLAAVFTLSVYVVNAVRSKNEITNACKIIAKSDADEFMISNIYKKYLCEPDPKKNILLLKRYHEMTAEWGSNPYLKELLNLDEVRDRAMLNWMYYNSYNKMGYTNKAKIYKGWFLKCKSDQQYRVSSDAEMIALFEEIDAATVRSMAKNKAAGETAK